MNATTGNQTTTYTYGTTLSDSAVASSQLKRYETYPDSVSGSDQVAFTYNRQSRVTTKTDQNGTIHSYDFDLLGRPTADRITTLGTGVDNAVLRISTTYEVRGLVQHITSYDNATVGSGNVVNDVQKAYNSFQQLTTEYQSHSGAVNVSTTPNVQYAYANGSANTIRPTSLMYPNGRVLNYNYGAVQGTNDAVSRVASLIDNDGVTHLADYSYLGGSTIIQVNEPQPAIQYTLIGIQGGNDPVTGDTYRGLDLFSRVKDLIWAPSGSSSSSSSSSSGPGTNLVRIQHGYDCAGNRLWRKDLVAESFNAGLDELYGYDGLYRLKSVNRGTLNSTQTAIQPGTGTFNQCWTLDSTDNWKGFREDDTGSGTWNLVQSRTANTVNEIMSVSNSVGSAWANPAYDKAGNMTIIPQPAAPASTYAGTYDAWDRVVKLVDTASGHTVQTNGYDGRNYRVIRNSFSSGVLSETRHCFYSWTWQDLEERVGTSINPDQQLVSGIRFIDDLLLRDRDTTGNGSLNERVYSMQDPLGSVVAVVDSRGIPQERYACSPYGTTEFLTAVFGARSATTLSWDTLLAGYRFDLLTGIYPIRNRKLLSPLGSWLSRDPIGYSGGINLYSYANAAPTGAVDRYGNVAYNPGRPSPPTPPDGSGLRWDLPSWVAIVSFLTLRSENCFRQKPLWIELVGTMLQEIQGQSQVIAYEAEVMKNVRGHVEGQMLSSTDCTEQYTITDGGSRTLKADLIFLAPIAVVLGQFTVYWEAACSTSGRCAGSMCYTTYRCQVAYTLYDEYDFASYDPFQYLGCTYPIFAHWSRLFGGVIASADKCC